MLFVSVSSTLACGSRRTVEQAEPTPPSSRGVVSSQKTDWQGIPSVGTIRSAVVKTPEKKAETPSINIFFLRQSLTTSDGDDFNEETEIKVWFGPEPLDH